MGSTVSKRTVIDSVWLRSLEYFLFASAAVFGILSLVFTLAPTFGSGGGDGLAFVVGLGMLALIPIGFVAAVVVAVAVYKDAEQVRAADLEWTPSAALYAVLGFLFSWLAAIDYLYKRYSYTASTPASSSWWYGVGGLLALVTISMVVSHVAFPLTAIQLPAVFAAGLPICLYKDCVYVRSVADDWRPNPVTYFTAAWFALLAVFALSFVGLLINLVLVGIYAYKRRVAGVP